MTLNKLSIIAFVATLASVACTPASLDGMTGKFAAPEELDLQTISIAGTEKQEGFRFITVNLSGNDQATIKFATKDYYLSSNTYYLNPAEGIKAGMFESGVSKINGVAITFGSIVVVSTQVDEENFDCSITGVVETGDNVRKHINWQGTMNFPPDPEPELLTKVLSATSNVQNGTMSVTINLATAGITTDFDMATYQTIYKGSGCYAAIDLYSADGYLHEGTYTPCTTPGNIQPGEYGIGWDPGDLWGIGMVFSNWGTCWWTVENGATSAEKISSGNIVVTKSGNNWVIEYNNYNVDKKWFKFTGAIEALTSPESQVTITWYDMVMNKGDEGSVTDENNTPVSGFDRYDVQLFDGETVVAAFDLVVTEGTDIAGEYVVKAYPHEDHVAGNGWGIAAWNFFGGTRIASGSDWLYVNPDSAISVAKTEEGYTFIADGVSFTNSASEEISTGSIALGGRINVI